MKQILSLFVPLALVVGLVLAGFREVESRSEANLDDWTLGESPWVLALSQGSPSHGREIYAYYCTVCHGLGGKGDGPNAANPTLMEKPRNHTDPTYMRERSDAQLFNVVTLGGEGMALSNLMPPFGDNETTDDIVEGPLTRQDVWDAVAYMRTLQE